MIQSNTRKHHVELKDYPFQRDIGIRLFFASLTELEKEVMEEIVNGSLKCSIKQIVSSLSTSAERIIPLLNRLHQLELFQMQGDQLCINKEIRKYFAYELEKFSPSFEPDLQNLNASLNKVPIHNLPQWYAIPRASDHIFTSIIEKYFQTPKLYSKHLEEIAIERPDLFRLYKMILQSPHLTLDSKTIIETFKLSHEEFEILMLEFEYNLCGCLCYQKSGNTWQECATFFSEWKHYLLSNKNTSPSLNSDDIKKLHLSDFGFVEEFSHFLENICETLFHLETKSSSPFYPTFVETAIALQLASLDNKKLIPSKRSLQLWQHKTKQEQASTLYQLLLNYARNTPEKIGGCTERELREIEKGLKTVAHQGWILFEHFFSGFKGAIRNHAPVVLHQKGKKWRYKFPEYGEEDQRFIQHIIVEYLWRAGIVSVGHCRNKPCFCVTPFGRMTLGD